MRKSFENGRIVLFTSGFFSPRNRNTMHNPVLKTAHGILVTTTNHHYHHHPCQDQVHTSFRTQSWGILMS